jgi:predicted glycogen debranching enzyme
VTLQGVTEVDLPKIQIGLNVFSNVNEALRMEWIVTNGLGGYASSTVLGTNTRKYHGLLVAAFNPPVNRWVTLTKLDEEIKISNNTYALGANEFRDVIYPEGHHFLSNFCLNPLPTYNYAVEGVSLQKTIFMPQGKNATIVIYDVSNPLEKEICVKISPLVNSRHIYRVTDRDRLAWRFDQKQLDGGVVITPSDQQLSLILSSDNDISFEDESWWVENIFFRTDAARNESSIDDYFRAGYFQVSVDPKEKKNFYVLAVTGKSEREAQNLFSTFDEGIENVSQLYRQELKRREKLLQIFRRRHTDPEMSDWLKWLIQAADSFIVKRASTGKKSVIAGYHWFDDWGRDSLISLPGLTLVTGRFEDAQEILLTFERCCQNGIIPNRFSDTPEDEPIYNTVDATLWFFNAVFQYLKYTGDYKFVQKKLWKTLNKIIEHHIQGTIFGIHMEDDGLIAHGPQLTWMDATTMKHFVTPRKGKAVEIQALWFNALKTMQLLASKFNQRDKTEEYFRIAEKAKKSFSEKFWNSQKEYLFDVISEDGADPSLRPNQIIATSLDFPILERKRRKKVLEIVGEKLWGTYGLKTLPNDDPRHIGKYIGDWNHRDSAYHNGTVWAWLLGPFTTAFLKIKNYEAKWRNFAFERFVQPLFCEEIRRAGLGTICEIFDGDEPHFSRGCISQAWSVAEPLRAYVEDVKLNRPPLEREVLEILAYQ